MIDTPQIVQSPWQLSAAIHLTIARNDIAQVFGPAVTTLLGVMGERDWRRPALCSATI